MAARDFGRDGRSKREMEVTEAREIETAVVCVCDALRPRTMVQARRVSWASQARVEICTLKA